MNSPDLYQQRYLEHQKRKAGVLAQLLAERHSDRVFSDEPVSSQGLEAVIDVAVRAPSSCNRQTIRIQKVEDRDRKALLGGLLVGGVGWVHRAPIVLLLHADRAAYRAGNEVEWMPYLDAGVAVGMMSLVAAANGLANCYINPSIRAANRNFFEQTFGSGMFCGALALGHPVEPLWVRDTS